MSSIPEGQVQMAPDAKTSSDTIAIIDSSAFQELVLPPDSTSELKKQVYNGLYSKFSKGVKGSEDMLDFGDFADVDQPEEVYTANDLLVSMTQAASGGLGDMTTKYLLMQLLNEDENAGGQKKKTKQMWENASEIDSYHTLNTDDSTVSKSTRVFNLLKQQEEIITAAADDSKPISQVTVADDDGNDDDMPALDGDDDLPPLEDHIDASVFNASDNQQDDKAVDSEDDDMPSLDDIDTSSPNPEVEAKFTSWLHAVAADKNEKTTTQQIQIDRQAELDQRIVAAEAAAAAAVEETAPSAPGFTSAQNTTPAKFDEGTISVSWDFRHNTIPPGASIVGSAQFERQRDGSTALVLHPGAYIELSPKFPAKAIKKGCYWVTLQIWLDSLPENAIALTTPDISRSGCGESVIQRDGAVAVVGGESTVPKLKPGMWQSVLIAINPNNKNSWYQSLSILINDRPGTASRDTSLFSEKAMLRDKFYLFGSNKNSAMERTIKIRSAVLQPKSLEQDAQALDTANFSQYFVETAAKKIEMYRSLSLSHLYNRPPTAWNHPLIQSTLIHSGPVEQLAGHAFDTSDLILWSTLLTETSESQYRLFPQVIDDSETITPPEDSEEQQPILVTGKNLTYVAGGLSKVAATFLDSAAIAKIHPNKSDAPTGASYIKRICNRVENLQLGEVTVIPFYIRYRVKPVDPKEPLTAAQTPIFIIVQLDAEDDKKCTVTICNTAIDGGVKYHSLSAAGSEGAMHYKPCIMVQDVPLVNLTSYGAWFAFHEAIYSAGLIGFGSISDIYFKMFPVLLGQPWEHILLQSQQRDVAFTKYKLQQSQQQQQQPEQLTRSQQFKLNQKYADCDSVPLIGVGTTTQLYHYTTQFLFRRILGCDVTQSTRLFLCLKLRCLDMVYNDLSHVNVINPSEVHSINISIKETAGYAAQCIELIDSNLDTKQHFTPNQLFSIYRGISRLQKEVKGSRLLSFSKKKQDTLLLDDGGRSKDSQHTLFPLVEQFILPRDAESVIDLGSINAITFDLLDLPHGVQSWGDVIYVLRRTKQICVALRGQETKIKNSVTLAQSFISHIFSTIVPVPTSPRASPEQRLNDPFAQPATYAEIVQVVELCSDFNILLFSLTVCETIEKRNKQNQFGFNGFIGQSMALSSTSETAADHYPFISQVISGAILVLLDLCLHKPPSDQRSPLVDTANQGGFGFQLGSWVVGTKGIHLHNPQLAILRSKIIEYFSLSTYPLNILNFGPSGGEPEYVALVKMLMLDISDNLHSDVSQMIFDLHQCSVYFKIPELSSYLSGTTAFRALNTSRLTLSKLHADPKQVYTKQFQIYLGGDKIQGNISNVRLPPFSLRSMPKYMSWADPQHIINDHLKKIHSQTASEDSFIPTPITTEDDVLHIKTLPPFENVLSPADIEQLLSYLTVPYLRIPLITSFFSTQDRCHALKNERLRDVLSAVLFEQGSLVPFHKESFLPTQVPSDDKTLIATHYGFLLNELVRDPRLIVNNLITMFNSALELDIGTVQSAATTIILYLVRILARVENYITWLVEINSNQIAAQSATTSSDSTTTTTTTTIAKKALYSADTLPGLLLTPDQLAELISVRELIGATTQGVALSKLNTWSAQLFTTVHMKLEQNEFAHQKADKFVKQAQAVITAQKAQDDRGDDESDNEEVQADGDDNMFAHQQRHRGRRGRGGWGRGGFGFGGATRGGDDRSKIRIPKFKKESDGMKKFQLQSSAQFKERMGAAGMVGAASRRRRGFDFLNKPNIGELYAAQGQGTNYTFEDNRPRRVISYQRRYTNIKSLDRDTAADSSTGNDGKAESGPVDEDDSKNGDGEEEEFVVNTVGVDGTTTTSVRLDGSELTDLFQLSCILHAHILMVRRNAEMTPQTACHIVSSIMYLTTHFQWSSTSSLVNSHDIFEIIHTQRRPLITMIDQLRQNSLNYFMEKVIKVATSIAPLDVQSMITYLKQELGYNSSQMKDPLPTDHPLYEQVLGFEQFDAIWNHSLSGAQIPIGYEGFNPDDESSVAPEHFTTRTLRHFGYSPGSRGRYTSLADPFTIQPANYPEYFSQVPGDLYEKNLDCEVNLQTLSISIKNATMQSIPSQVENSSEWLTVFKKSLQAALIESNSQFDHYRVIGTGYDTYYRKQQKCTVEIVNQRVYAAEELYPSENWLSPILEPYRLKHLNDPWLPLVLYLPDAPTPENADVVVIQVIARRSGRAIAKLHVHKTRKFVECFSYLEYNLRMWPVLMHTSDVRYSIASEVMPAGKRESMWNVYDRYESTFPGLSERPAFIEVVIQRDTTEVANLSGSTETFMPRELLYGFVPHKLSDYYDFWQDSVGNLRGYPIDVVNETAKQLAPINFQDYVIYCELITVSKHDATQIRTTCFQISKVPIPVLKIVLSNQLKAAAFGSKPTLLTQGSLAQQSSAQVTNTTTYNPEDLLLIPHSLAEKRSTVLKQPALKQSTSSSSTTAAAQPKGKDNRNPEGDQIFELINMRDAPRTSATYQISSVLARTVNTLSPILAWKPASGTFNHAGIQLNNSMILPHYDDSFGDQNGDKSNEANTVMLAREQDTLLVDNDDAEHIDPIFGANSAVLDLDVVKKRAAASSRLINFHHIEIPPIGLSFRSQFNSNNEIQLYSIDHNDLYISNTQTQQLDNLLNGLPTSLVLQNINGELEIITPAVVIQRPIIIDSPYTTELVSADSLVSSSNTYFKYKVHTSHSFVFLPTLASALYLILGKFLARDYDSVIKLLDSISADIPFTPPENSIFDLLSGSMGDIINPNALATMIRISLATLKAAKQQPWDVVILSLYYSALNSRLNVSNLHRLSQRDEYDLLKQLMVPGTLQAAIKMSSGTSMHHGIFILAAYNRFTYLTSLLYKLPSYKVLLPPQTTHASSYATTNMPGIEDFVVWYTQTIKLVNLKSIPAHTLNDPSVKPIPGMASTPTTNSLQFNAPAATAQEELQNTIPLSILAKLPSTTAFKCDITKLSTNFTFIGTLTSMSAQSLLQIALKGSATHSNGYGFILAYMLLTGDCAFRLHNRDESAALGAVLAQLYKDVSHNSPLNFILRLLILKPELTPLFPRLSQFKPLAQIRNQHVTTSTFDLAPFVMMISRVIVKVFVVSPSSFDLKKPSKSSTWTITPGTAKKLSPAAETIPISISSVVPALQQRASLKRESLSPVLTDTDCSTRFSLDHNLFFTPETIAQLGPILGDFLAQEKNESVALGNNTTTTTKLSQLQTQPITTLEIQHFVKQVTRQDKSLPSISESLPFDIADHPAAQNGNAKLMKDRFEKDIVVYAQGANKTFDSLFASLSSAAQVRTVLESPSGTEMKTSLAQLDKLARSVVILRQQDIKFISVCQKLINVLVNNVGLPNQYQSKVEKMYTISTTTFHDDDFSKSEQLSGDELSPTDKRQVTERFHYLIARESGAETKLWFEYVVGSLLSSRAAYDLLKINPYIPDQHLAVIYSLTEAVLLRTNRISHVNRVLNEIIDLQDLLYRVKSVYNASQDTTGGLNNVDNVVLNSILQKSQTMIKSLFTKRYYFHDVDQEELDIVRDKLKHDESMKQAWDKMLSSARANVVNNRSTQSSGSTSIPIAPSVIMIEQLSRLLDVAIIKRDVQLLEQQSTAAKGNIDAATASGTVLMKPTALTTKNKRHLAKQLLVDPLAQVQAHPLKPSCPINDRVGFLLKAVKKRTNIYINESWSRVQNGQGVNTQDNPLWDALYQTPDHVPQLYRAAKQGRFGLSLYSRAGMSLDVLGDDSKVSTKGLKKYDPRFLVFEWTWSLLLRGAQVDMIYSFVDKMERGESTVVQLIMGGGKTTIIMPILFQLLSSSKENTYSRQLGKKARQAVVEKTDSQTATTVDTNTVKEDHLSSNMDRLIISVVPPSLLEFSRSIMRSTFSSVVYKKVITFNFERATEPTYELLQKLKNAAKERSVVISTPTAIKSVQLKFLELQYSIANPALGRDVNAVSQMNILAEILQLFSRSTLLLDEVDLILHPLKSELNFPFSHKTDLDFSPLRWALALHIMDAVLFYDQRQVPHNFKHSTRALSILDNLISCLDYGFTKKYLQSTPHLLLLNEPFYFNRLQPHLVEWILLFIDTQHLPGQLTHAHIKKFFATTTMALTNSTDPEIIQLTAILETISPQHMKLLNLSKDWLNSFLPHILQKVSRVHYGLLSPQDLVMALNTDPAIPLSRLKLAIPFKGKDSPSASSEFAHSEIIIGLTISSYSREGLRYTDFVEIIDSLRSSLVKELGPYSKRPTNVRYIEWVTAAGGNVMGTAKPTSKKSLQHDDNKDDRVGGESDDECGGGDEDSKDGVEIVSLRLLKRTNYQQMDRLYNLLKHSPLVIQFYLDTMIFPACLRHQNLKLSASGVDIGSDLLFSKRIGFSGTPSDLLPIDFPGGCNYELGSDGQVVTTLTSPEVANVVHIENNWSIQSILNLIAQARTPEGNLKYHAFIDVAALITGLSNLDVSDYLLKNGLGDHVDAVVYLDESDKKMALLKSNGKSVPVDQCGIPPNRRFAFYDQVHTTGIDIAHRLDCHAAVTLSKDSLFRDFSQGAYRLRQIGQGQTLDILLTPEMKSLIDRTLSPIETDADGKRNVAESKLLAPLRTILAQRNVTDPELISRYQDLSRISAFLIINSMIAERTQFCQLAIQNCQIVWKKNVFKELLKNTQYFNFTRFPNLEDNIKREKMLEKQQEDTKQQKFLTSIEAVRETDRKQYSKLVKRYQLVKKQNKMIEQKRQQQTLLEDYFEQTMSIYNIHLRAQLKNMSANRNPATAIDNLLLSLRRYLQRLRKDYYSSNPNHDPKTQSSLLGRIGGYVVDFDEDNSTIGAAEQVQNEAGALIVAEAKSDEETITPASSTDSKLVGHFVSEDEMNQYNNPTKRDLEFESLMSVFHETVDLTICQTVPKFVSFAESLESRIKLHEHLLETSTEREICTKIFTSVKETANAQETFTLNAEMVQTMEDERVKEQEQDREQQVEIEKFVDCAYDRTAEAQVSWPFESLSNTDMGQLPQFYHLNEFSVVPLSTHTLNVFENHDAERVEFFSSAANRLTAKFPSQFYATSNYYNNAWVGARRLKNVCMYLDWSPSLAQIMPVTDLAKIQTRSTLDLTIDPKLCRDIEVTIKTLVFLSTCQDGIDNNTSTSPAAGGKSNYDDLYKLLSQPWEQIELTPANVDDLLYLMTMRRNVTESVGSTHPALEFVSDNNTDAATLMNTQIATQLNLNHSHLFNGKATINAKDLVTALAQTTAVLYPGNTYQDNRYTVIVSLSEAETIRRIVHVKQEIAMQQHMAQRHKQLRQQQQGGSSTELSLFTAAPQEQSIIAKSDAGFALRCMNFNGISLATTTNYLQPSYTQFSNSLLMLRFLNNEVHYSDPQIHALISLLDGNVTTTPFGLDTQPELNQFGIPQPSLSQFFTSLLSARRRLQTKLTESSLKTILYTPHRYSLIKNSALALIIRRFIDIAQLASFDLFTWMDFNIDTSISPGELYRALQYIMVNMWKYYAQGDVSSGPDAQTVLSETYKDFFINHQDIIHLFTSVLGISAITSNSSSSTPAKDTNNKSTDDVPAVNTSTQTFQLSQQAFGLTFKDMCALLKTSEEPDLEDVLPETTATTTTTITTTEPLSPNGALPSPVSQSVIVPLTPTTTGNTPTIPLDDGLKSLDHDVFVQLLSNNMVTKEQVDKSLYIIPVISTTGDKQDGDDTTNDTTDKDSGEDKIDSLDEDDDDGDDVDDDKDNQDEQSIRDRLTAVAKQPLVHDTKQKTIAFNFTTPELPEFVELIGDGKFVDAGTGNVADNYWELGPYSAFVIRTTQLLKKFNLASRSPYFSMECSIPQIKTTQQHEGIYEFQPTHFQSNLGQLYQEFTLANSSLQKFIFCFQLKRDHSYWINPAEIEAVIDQDTVKRYLSIQQKAEDGDAESAKAMDSWTFELRRAAKYYVNSEAAIQAEIVRNTALYPICGAEVLNNPRLVQQLGYQPELLRFIIAPYEPSENSILPNAPRSSLVISDKQMLLSGSGTTKCTHFTEDNFSVLTMWTPDNGNDDNVQQSKAVVNAEVINEYMYGVPSYNSVDLTLFGSSDFVSCRTPVRLRKFMFFLREGKRGSQMLKQPLTYNPKHFKTNFMTAFSAAATASSSANPASPMGMGGPEDFMGGFGGFDGEGEGGFDPAMAQAHFAAMFGGAGGQFGGPGGGFGGDDDDMGGYGDEQDYEDE